MRRPGRQYASILQQFPPGKDKSEGAARGRLRDSRWAKKPPAAARPIISGRESPCIRGARSSFCRFSNRRAQARCLSISRLRRRISLLKEPSDIPHRRFCLSPGFAKAEHGAELALIQQYCRQNQTLCQYKHAEADVNRL